MPLDAPVTTTTGDSAIAADSNLTRVLKLTPHESVEIRSDTPEALEVEVRYEPGGSPPPKHLHPAQEEHFQVLEGEMRTRVDGEERTLHAGDAIDIPRRAVHQIWNPGGAPTRATWITKPAGRTRQWFEAIDSLHREGRVGRNGMPSPLAFAVFLTEYDDVFQLVAGPRPLVYGALRALAPIGRRRGYSPHPG